MNPRTAKLRFRLRTFNNLAVVVIAIAAIALFAARLRYAWIIDGVAIVSFYFLYFYVLESRAIGIFCDHCRKYLATNTPWVCGFCKKPNLKADEHPFVDRCEHCRAESKAYRCHHCSQPIFLSSDQTTLNMAYCLNSTGRVPEADTIEEKLKARSEEKDERRHRIELAELDNKLNSLLRAAELSNPKNVREKLIQKVDDELDSKLTVEERLDQREETARQTLKGRALERALAAIEHCRRELA